MLNTQLPEIQPHDDTVPIPASVNVFPMEKMKNLFFHLGTWELGVTNSLMICVVC